MKEFTTTLTKGGQVTLPAEIRKRLHIGPRDKVSFRLRDDETVEVAPKGFSWKDAFGSVKSSRKPEDFKKISQEAREAHAEKTIRKMARS